MDLKTILKWGAILLVIYFVWQWITNQFANGGSIIPGGFGVMNAPYAAPIPGPYTGVIGWAAPWQYAGQRYGGRPRRFRR